jgi:PKD domain
MRGDPFKQNFVLTVLFSLLATLSLSACGDSNNVSAPPGPPPPAPGSPVANAGPDLGNIRPGQTITLDGSSSFDPEGDPLTYSWSLSAPAGSAAVLANPDSVRPTFTVDRDGDYVVQLIVNDGRLNSAPDIAIFSSNNVGPVANAGPDQGGKAPGSPITLNGSGSSDANGDPLTYSWSLSTPAGSAAVLANPTSVRPNFTIDRDGDYIAQLIVHDGTVPSTPDSVTITSNNVAPVANAGPDQGGAAPGSTITLDGIGSSDANGDPLTYSWSFQSKPTGSAAVLSNPTSVSPTFIVDRDGDYVVQLIVSDGTVNSVPNSVTITSDNVAPVANSGSDQDGVSIGSLITLDGSASFDANGDPLTYSWSLNVPAGSTATLNNPTSLSPTFTVDIAGNYVAQLIVNDGTVDSAPDSVIITAN